MDEIYNIKESKKQLDEYFSMLLSGKYESKYIIHKIKHWCGVISHDSSFADKQIKDKK